MPVLLRGFLAACILVGVAAPVLVSATTVVLVDTSDLVARAERIVVGRVIAREEAATQERLQTSIRVAVDEVVKGPPASELSIVEPGGTGPTQRRWVHGAPRFVVGERVVLFLVHNRRQELETLFLGLGKFTIVHDLGGGDVAVRSLNGMRALSVHSGRLEVAPRVTAHPFKELLVALRAMAAGMPVPPVATVGFQSGFTFSGPAMTRWVEPDTDIALGYFLSRTSDAALGAAASVAAADAALAAWSGASCSALDLVDVGSADPAPFSDCDRRTQITFNDPFDEMTDPVRCSGVLALGGVCASSDVSQVFNGTQFARITEGDVVVNNGFGDCPFWNQQNLAELLTHEIGHTVGLAHASEDPDQPDPSLREATMYYTAHFDGRGAVLANDDVAAVCILYPARHDPAVTFRRFAIVSDPTRPWPSDRLVVSGVFEATDAGFDPLSDTFIFDLYGAGVSLFRLAVTPEQWEVSPSGTRFRYRNTNTLGTTSLTLSTATPGVARLNLQARRLDLSAADVAPIVVTLAVGRAVVSETVAAARFTARNQSAP